MKYLNYYSTMFPSGLEWHVQLGEAPTRLKTLPTYEEGRLLINDGGRVLIPVPCPTAANSMLSLRLVILHHLFLSLICLMPDKIASVIAEKLFH